MSDSFMKRLFVIIAYMCLVFIINSTVLLPYDYELQGLYWLHERVCGEGEREMDRHTSRQTRQTQKRQWKDG